MAHHPPVNTSFSRFLAFTILYILHIALACYFLFAIFNASPYKQLYNPSASNPGVFVKLQGSKPARITYGFVKDGVHGGDAGLRYKEMDNGKDSETNWAVRGLATLRERLEGGEARAGC